MKNIKTFWTLAAGIAGMTLLFGGVLIFLLRYTGAVSAESKGQMAASIIREALTSHMIAGSSEYQTDLLAQIGSIEGVRSVWVVRAEAVSRQYGKGVAPQEPRDEIDRAVLREGKSYDVTEGALFADTRYRLSIPYTATDKGKIDCMGCHDSKAGEVLGAVSIEMEINELKMAGMMALAGVLIALGAYAVYLLRAIRGFIASYKESLEEVGRAIEKAEEGDYTCRIEPPESKEGYKAAMWTNALLEKLDKSLSQSSETISSLIRVENPKNDPLYAVESGIARIYEIGQFREAIEKDHTLEEVYGRLIALMRTRWSVKEFTLLELNPMNKEVRHIHSEKTLLCDALNSGCRADRTTGTVDSLVCESACPKMIDPNIHYVCRNYPVADDLDIVVSLQNDDGREVPKMRAILEQLGDFIAALRLQIINKKLEKSVRIDPLTGLYNRPYLEELCGLVVAQSKRTAIPYGVLMVDMDGFGSINRSYDTQVGDEVIKAMGRNIQEAMKPGDVLIRYGNDTFAVVLYDYEQDEALKCAEAIRESFKKKIRINTYAILKTVSIGIAFFPSQTQEMNEAVELAKRAVLEAKHQGGNCSVVYDPKSMPM